MRTVSDLWRSTVLSGAMTYVETATVLNEKGEPSGPELRVVSGSMTEDATATVRHDFDLVVADPDGSLTPLGATDPLSPYTKRVRIQRGFVYADGTTESVTVVTGWLTSARVRAGEGTVALSGMDRAARLQRPSVRPVAVPAGRAAQLAIRDLLWSVDPSMDFDLMVSPWTLPRLAYEVETDLMAEAVELAKSIGAQVYVNRDDQVVLRPVPIATHPHVGTLTEGVNATVLSAEQGWESDQVPNGIIGISQHSSLPAPIRAEAWDMDPTSATYRFGEYSERPRFIRTEKAATFGQLQDMVDAELELALGGSNEIELEAIPDPSLEADDVVLCDLPSIGASGLYIVTRIGLTLGDPSASMAVTLRSGVRI